MMYTHRYNMYRNHLEHVFEEKALDVTTDVELRCEEHISAKVKKRIQWWASFAEVSRC